MAKVLAVNGGDGFHASDTTNGGPEICALSATVCGSKTLPTESKVYPLKSGMLRRLFATHNYARDLHAGFTQLHTAAENLCP